MIISITTQRKDAVVDITNTISELIQKSEKEEGVCHLFVLHTTCAITTADLDPGTDQDFLNFLRKIVPSMEFNHPHDPRHAPDHLLSSVIGSSVTVPFQNKKLILGTWQRVVLVELDGPRVRQLSVTI